MASSILLTCPECDKQLKASSAVLGKKIRCKACGATFVGRAGKDAPGKDKAPAKAVTKDKPAPSENDDNDMSPYGVTHEYLGRRCPDCASPIEENQVVCLHCGYNNLTRQKARKVKVQDTTGADVAVWLLPGILCIFAIFVVFTSLMIFIFMVSEATFGDVWYDFLGGKMIKIYSSLISLFIIYKCARFAVSRLLYNSKPPEVEDKSREDDEE